MINKNKKNETLGILEIMIQNADKGPSGFWVDDHEGCGNFDVFPEFKEGLIRGSLVQKEHMLCPWNTAVLYGEGHGNISTGCYHSCSISKARYLSPEMIKAVLVRFKKRLRSDYYDDLENFKPLLTENEINYIEKQIRKEKQSDKHKRNIEREIRMKNASNLIKKFPELQDVFSEYYGEEKAWYSPKFGIVDFRLDGMKKIVGAENFSYDEYIKVQLNPENKPRMGFLNLIYNYPLSFKGCIEKKNPQKICFERIWIEGMDPDGECFDDKEDHVWMDIKGFESFEVGDSLSFAAEVYRYVKTGNGKSINYGLRNPENIIKIFSYKLPSNQELKKQAINHLICENCYLAENCNRSFCMFRKSVNKQTQAMLDILTNDFDDQTDVR